MNPEVSKGIIGDPSNVPLSRLVTQSSHKGKRYIYLLFYKNHQMLPQKTPQPPTQPNGSSSSSYVSHFYYAKAYFANSPIPLQKSPNPTLFLLIPGSPQNPNHLSLSFLSPLLLFSLPSQPPFHCSRRVR